jgi:hypothetical protein
MWIEMAVKITTPIPSVEETAKLLGVSKKRTAELVRFAESLARSAPRSGVRESRKTRRTPSPEQTTRIPAQRIVTAAKKVAKRAAGVRKD